jgi:hypothetical protein
LYNNFIYLGIEQMIEESSIFKGALLKSSLQHKACRLKDPGRSSIDCTRLSINAMQVKLLKTILAYGFYSLGRDSPTPERLCQPITMRSHL